MHTLRFIRRAHELWFSMAELAALPEPWQDRRRASADVKRTRCRIWPIGRMSEMAAMKRTLEALAACGTVMSARSD